MSIQEPGWRHSTIQTATPPPSFDMCMFILCHSDGGDFGRAVSVNVEVLGPSGERLKTLRPTRPSRAPGHGLRRHPGARLTGGLGRYTYRAWLDDELGSAVARRSASLFSRRRSNHSSRE